MRYSPFNNFKEAVQNSIVKVEAQLNSRGGSHFEVNRLYLAGLVIYDISIEPITICRREEDILADGVDDFFLSLLVEGETILRQGACNIKMQPGELAVNANGQPHTIEYTKPSRRLLLHIPKQIYYERILGRRSMEVDLLLLGKAGLASIVSSMLKALVLKADILIEIDQHVLSESLLKLVGTLVRSTEKFEQNWTNDNQIDLLRKALNYMDKHYADRDLSPEKVAVANGISMRYLHRIFEHSGVGVSKWIWERRLKATREDLLNPQKLNMRISEIAFSRGFGDPAHFSRSFRVRFGISPSKLRAKVSDD